MNMEVGNEYIRLSELNGRRCDAVMFDYNVVINETDAGNYVFSRQPDVSGWSDFRFDLTAHNVVDVNFTYGSDVFYDPDVNDVYGDFVLVDNGVVSWGWSEPVYYYGFEGSQSAAENIWVRVVEDGDYEEPENPDEPDTPVEPDEPTEPDTPEYDGPTIADNLQRIITAKADIKVAIENKGVYVGDVTIDEYASKIDEISEGAIQKVKLYNGISFSGSTFETMQWDRYDWSDIYDAQYLFVDCANLNNIEGLFDNLTNIYDASFMFKGCTNLTEIVGLDMTNWENAHQFLSTNGVIEKFRDCKLKSWKNTDNFIGNSKYYMLYATYENCDFTNCISLAPYMGAFAYITGLNEEMTKLDSDFSMCVLDCPKPSNLTSWSGYGAVCYKPNVGWEEIFGTISSRYPMGTTFSLFGNYSDLNFEYHCKYRVNSDRLYEYVDVFQHMGDGVFTCDFLHYWEGDLIMNGVNLGSVHVKDLHDKTLYAPNLNLPSYVEGQDILFNCIAIINKGWEYDEVLNAVKSTEHTDGNTQDMNIYTGDYTQMVINYGQSSENGYDYLEILAPDKTTIIADTKYKDGNNLELVVDNIGDYDYVIFRWKKDGSGSKGDDMVWINSISYN